MNRSLLFALLILLAVRVSFIAADPIGSDDLYRYMWDGRVQSAGINPYRFAPSDTALAPLHTSRLPVLVNHPGMKTIYFPLSQWIFVAATFLSGDQVWGFHILILLAECMTVTGLLQLTRLLGFSPWYVLLYAANPLVVYQFALDSHVDVFGFPFLVFGLLFFFRQRTTPALLLLGCSMQIKPIAAAFLPIIFFSVKGAGRKAAVLLVPLLCLAVPFLPYMIDANPFESLTTFSRHWFFNGALFSILLPLFDDNQTARLWSMGILVPLIALVTWSRRPLPERIVLAVLVTLLCSPVAHPWYMGWLIAVLPLAPLPAGIALAATASFSTITFVMYELHGEWRDYPGILALEYVPVVLLLIRDLLPHRSGVAKEIPG